MLRLTLDTNCVIHAAQAQSYGPDVDRLVDFARAGTVSLWITTAFEVDQARLDPSDERRLVNLRWLSRRPMITQIPGPFRLDYSKFDGPDILVEDDHLAPDECIREILLTQKYRSAPPGQDDDPAAFKKWRNKISDVQHLSAHLLAKHDVFVTSDEDDMWKKRDLLTACGIVIKNPSEAVAYALAASQQPGPQAATLDEPE